LGHSVPLLVQDALVKVIPEHGLELLYRAHGARLWRALVAFAGDREVADDAMAEAFAQALRRGGELRDPLRWVWKSAFRIAAGELKERRRVAPLEIERAYEAAGPLVDLLAALGKLSEKQRAAVVLHHYAGYPVTEVADIIGSTAAAVKVHLMRGRARLRIFLGDDDA
jgi:RNA polymerase sigma-70 factor (ECF subfamily)